MIRGLLYSIRKYFARWGRHTSDEVRRIDDVGVSPTNVIKMDINEDRIDHLWATGTLDEVVGRAHRNEVTVGGFCAHVSGTDNDEDVVIGHHLPGHMITAYHVTEGDTECDGFSTVVAASICETEIHELAHWALGEENDDLDQIEHQKWQETLWPLVGYINDVEVRIDGEAAWFVDEEEITHDNDDVPELVATTDNDD